MLKKINQKLKNILQYVTFSWEQSNKIVKITSLFLLFFFICFAGIIIWGCNNWKYKNDNIIEEIVEEIIEQKTDLKLDLTPFSLEKQKVNPPYRFEK